MKTRIIVAAVLLPVFFCVLFIFPPIVLTVIISIINIIAVYELLNAVNMSRNKSVLVYTMVSAGLIPFSIYLSFRMAATDHAPGTITGTLTVIFLYTLLLSIFFIFISLLLIEAVLTIKNTKAIEKGTQLKFRQIPIALTAGLLIPLMLSTLIGLKTMPYGHLFVLLPVIATVLTDSGAYFIGVTMGKRKVFPTISPNKTAEGFVGGIIIGTAGMLLYGLILSLTTPLTIIFPVLILYGLLGAIVTEAGDLMFSLIKRKCGIKDYGNLFPGHGGALDRFDSMTFAAPTMLLLVTFIPAIVV